MSDFQTPSVREGQKIVEQFRTNSLGYIEDRRLELEGQPRRDPCQDVRRQSQNSCSSASASRIARH